MADTSIEWSDKTWNPVVGCTRASAGCDNCYAVKMSFRLENLGQEKYKGLTVVNGRGDRHFNGVVRCVEQDLVVPFKWKKGKRIFVNSMSDLFHRDVPFEFIDKVFAVMALCPQHTFQVLTKRPERMAEYLHDRLQPAIGETVGVSRVGLISQECYRILETRNLLDPDSESLWTGDGRSKFMGWQWPLPNVWLGTSTEDQATADERIPELLKCPAAVRFLSCEPLIGEIDLSRAMTARVVAAAPGDGSVCITPERDGSLQRIHWAIWGGESGPGSRTCTIGHIRSGVKQCAAAGVPCFVKQLGRHPVNREGVPHPLKDPKGGDWSEWPEDLRVRQYPEVQYA